jgi:hypothetical protein
MAGTSCVDCVEPALGLMRKRLFAPFRFSYWWRIAILGVLAGELSSGNKGGGGGGNGLQGKMPHKGMEHFDPAWIAQHWNLIFGLIGGAIVLALLCFYINSVLRFVLYEAVLRDKAHIREGFARWTEQGFEYFCFRLMLSVPFAALAIYLIAMPLFHIFTGGGGKAEVLAELPKLIGAGLLVACLGVMLAIVMVLTKDFVVPQMMFEGVSCTEGWGRLWSRIKAETGSFVAYIVLKIAMAIAAGIAFFVVMLVVGLVVGIPIGAATVASFMGFKAAGASMASLILGGLAMLVIAIPVVIFCVGLLGAPISVFFPAYSIYFFASRYKPLYDELYPPAPTQPVAQS